MGEWLAFKRQALSPKSVELYAACMRRYISPALGRRRVTSLTPRDLDLFYGALAKDGSERLWRPSSAFDDSSRTLPRGQVTDGRQQGRPYRLCPFHNIPVELPLQLSEPS